MEIVFGDYAIARYLQKARSCERENLKGMMMALASELRKRDILVPMGFQPYGKSLYSESFNRDMGFLESCGIVREQDIGGNLVYVFSDKDDLISRFPDISENANSEMDRAIEFICERYPGQRLLE